MRYYLEIWQGMTNVAGGHEIAAQQHARAGRLNAARAMLRRRLHIGELQLHMANGRWVDVAVTSTDGTLQALGSIRASR